MNILQRPTTVQQRMQNNGGFITGPNHTLLGTSAPAPAKPASPLDDAQPGATGEAAAPNYREAGSPSESCMSCANHDEHAGMCTKYQFNDQPTMVCDSFEPAGADQGGEMDADPGMMGGGGTLG